MSKYKPIVVSSLHGFKSHGKWQTKFADFMSFNGLSISSFDYGYQFFSCLKLGFKKRLIEDFYEQYSRLIRNVDYQIDVNTPTRRPSIVAHSLGSYILCNAMLKYPDIRFDKIILCGSIVKEDFDWDTLFNRNQVHFVRNEFSPRDKIVRWAWILSKNNSGRSGWQGFSSSSLSLEQIKYDYFDHGTFFEGNHMKEFWLPFLLREPPRFQVIKGKDLESIPSFKKLFDQTTLIDDACYGHEPNWDEYSIPDDLAEQWVQVNQDIYSFLIKSEGAEEVIGYINAMPLKEEVFIKLIEGKVHDQDVKPSDIISYNNAIDDINLYVMSIALNPSYQAMHLGLKDLGFEKLLNSLFDKLESYYLNYRVKVKKIAAVGWTEKGVRLCQHLGLTPTGAVEEKTNKPIYLLNLENAISSNKLHKSIRKLIELYKS